MAKRQRADIKAALAAASGTDEPTIESPLRKEVIFDTPSTDEKISGEEILERGGERREKKSKTGHKRTSTGYVKSDGQEVVRLTLHMSAQQKKAFRIRMAMSGHDNPSAFVIAALSLNQDPTQEG